MNAIRSIARRIVDGRLSPYGGAKAIWELTVDDPTLNPNHELDEFILAASEWDEPRWTAIVIERAKKILDV